MTGLHAALAALLEKEVAEAADRGARSERADVRCLDCGLRYDERQQYGCHESGRGHSYDEDDLAEADERGRQVDLDCVSVSVAEVRALLDEHPADLPVATDSTTVEAVSEIQAAREAIAWWISAWAEARAVLGSVADRLDEHTYSEFAAVLDDEPYDHEGEPYRAPAPEPSDSPMVALVERSSFGTPEAVALRASVSDEVAARVVARAKELEADAPEPSDRAGLSEGERAANTALSVWSTTCHAYCSEEDRVHSPECLLAAGLHRSLADRLTVAEQERTRQRDSLSAHADELASERNQALARAEAAEQEAATLRAQIAAVEEDLVESRARCADLSDYASRHKARADAAERQVVAVEVLARNNEWEASEDRPGGVTLLNPRDVRAALGDSAQVVQRIKDEAAADALEEAAVELDSHVCTEPCSDMAAGAPCPYADAARIVRERVRRVWDGGDHG